MTLKMPSKVNMEYLSVSDTSIETVEELLSLGADKSRRLLIATPNLHFFALARKNTEFRNILKKFDLLLPDGWPVSIALSLKLNRWRPRIPGSDLFSRILTSEKFLEYEIMVIGGRKSQQSIIQDFMLSRKNLRIYSPDDNFEIAGEVNEIQAFIDASRRIEKRFLVICLGFPTQEQLALKLSILNNFPILCLGASLDFALGFQRRAPIIVQRVGMEWFWRLIFSPKRLWRRYLVEDLPALTSIFRIGLGK